MLVPFDDWLKRAREGDPGKLAELLDSYRNYLRLLARMQIHKLVQIRVSASDVAQESILRATKAFKGFRGDSELELLSWLRRVLASELAMTVRFHSADRRNVELEQRFDTSVEQSSCCLSRFVSTENKSPSRIAVQREQSVILAETLERLPDDYREVIVMRHLESRSFSEIAGTMGRTVPSVKSVWTRAITRLRDELKELQ